MKFLLLEIVLCACLISLSRADGIATPSSQSLCDMPSMRGTAAYNKYCTGGTMAVPQVPSTNPAQNMMNQMGQQMIFNGVQSLFHSDDKTPEQIEAERQAEIARRQQAEQQKRDRELQEEADHQKMKSEMKLTGSTGSDDLGIKRAGAEDSDASLHLETTGDDIKRHNDEEEKKDMPKKRSDAFNKGFEHGSGCFSQNSMSACGAVSADQTDACLADYRRGYQVGDKRRRLAMDEAFRAGKRAGTNGELDNGASDPRADGPCRDSWVEAYSRGHFEGKAARGRP